MKESGIDWIGQIPQGWGVKAIKYIFDEIGSGSTPKSDNEIFYDGDINWIQSGDLYQTDTVTSVSKTISYQGFKSTSALKIYKHPFIALAMYGASVGNVAISCIDACVNQAVVVMLGTSETVRFGKYAIEASKNNLIFSAQGGTQPNISQSLIKNWNIPQPDSSEQTKIADFLDKKTAQLDKAKALLEKQIQKLKDYRASLIYETVTKGLDKTVTMKDSGIDWIGQVPEGWGVKRLKDYVDFQTGTTPPQSIGVNQERKGVRWFKPGDFSDESVNLTSAENYITSEVVNQQKLSVYPEKTILVVGIASIGKVGYSENHSYSNQQITALKVTGQIFPKYLAYLMFSSGQYIRETALYTIVPIINNQYLSSLKIVLPNRVVQETIVEYLDKKIGQINKMIAIKNEQIKNINKQRQTLIYDYVTGKRRV